MHVRFLLGPAGSGKTFRCLAEIRTALAASPEGSPLILLAPKQATFQLERQLLSDGTLAGYTRLHILSFERVAEFVFDQLQRPTPELLAEQGRVMVLRALLGERQQELKLFRASARMPGFAQQLSTLLRELHRYRLSPGVLAKLTGKVGPNTPLGRKLYDFALLLRAYLEWLKVHALEDADSLLDLAADALASVKLRDLLGELAGSKFLDVPSQLTLDLERKGTHASFGPQHSEFLRVAGLWLDGFSQMTPQQRRLLMALIPHCAKATLAFCLEDEPPERMPWHSPWSLISQTFRQCQADLAALPGSEVEVEVLRRDVAKSRFAGQPALQHLEQHWSQPQPFDAEGQSSILDLQSSIRLVRCPNAEAEATLAAREILRFVRARGRFRETAVLVRQLALYHDSIRRVFLRYEIPFFLDRREPVAHHPLAELTRSALRTVAFGWQHHDWFGALKTGLVHNSEGAIDHLENEALARGWQGKVWQTGLKPEGGVASARELEAVRAAVMPAFLGLERALESPPSGRSLAAAIRQFWDELSVQATLEEWSRNELANLTLEFSNSIHATVWKQMHDWLDSLALAFPRETQPLSRWLPIIEAGLSGLTVGVVPPALDQVLVGAIDRSRNPDLRQVFVLGLNETIFPAVPSPLNLLNGLDREQLEKLGHPIGADTRLQLGHERFYGYIACTRASERPVLTFSQRDADGKALNPSAFVFHLQRLFPKLVVEEFSAEQQHWANADHPSELIGPFLSGLADSPSTEAIATLRQIPALAQALERLQQLHPLSTEEQLSPELAEQLYSSILTTSVSRLEQFAACPFRFFINSGLQAEERKLFELDVRERGTFQHEVLALFHQQLRDEGKRWRDVTPEEASERVGRICDELIPRFQQGMLQVTPENLFAARSYKGALQRFVATIIGWMQQCEFDPVVVEIGFGRDGRLPAWELELGEGHRLVLHGRIDRVDVWTAPGTDEALCIVIDYKSSLRKPDPLLLEHGIQQQLPAYLNVLRRLKAAEAQTIFGVSELRPVGVFYVNLRGSYGGGSNRTEVLSAASEAQRLAYQHQGLFDLNALPRLDTRKGVSQGDQFNYRLRQDGEPFKNGGGVMNSSEFVTLLDRNEAMLRELGRRIFTGQAQVDPFRKGQDIACASCDYQAICRIDPWTHSFRVLSARSSKQE